MKASWIPLALPILLMITGCKPDPYPKHPRYEVKKPKIIYTPEKKNLQKMVKQLQGSPYVWAEEGPDTFDCSGFTYYMYGSMGIELPRVAREQAKVGKKVSPQELRYGDLIFFATDKRHPHKITHVGMYLGDGWFTHASTVKHEVVYSNLFTSPYYKKRLRICRRYLPEKTTAVASSEQSWQTKSIPSKTAPAPDLDKPSYTQQGRDIVLQTPRQQIEQSHKKGNFYVQVGSFVGRPNATLIYKIGSEGFSHKIITFPREGKTINKLLIGPYLSRSDALKARDKVRKRIQKSAFIAEIR